MFSSLGYLSISEEPAIEIHPTHSEFYQERPCTFSLFEMLSQDEKLYTIELLTDPSGNIECFGKNSWFEYKPAKLIENGWDKFEPEKITLWFSTNLHLDLMIQSLFWIILLSLIPSKNNYKISKPILLSLVNTVIFYIHLIGEQPFYKNISRDVDINLISREYNGDLYYKNYFLYLFCLLIFLTSYLITKIIESKYENLINYFPFSFLIFGTYASLNLNFYLIVFSILGLHYLFKRKINFKITMTYLFFTIFWYINLDNRDINFDVDKVRGFINSSQSTSSLFFWSLIYYLVISGVVYYVKDNISNFKLKVFRRNLLITSSLIFIFGSFAAINKLFNFISFYFLGLNKFGIRSLDSIDGNTWRGIAPSAEGMGEFFAFSILFVLISSSTIKEKLSFYDFVFLSITFFGLLRTNNFAAISSMILLLLIYFTYLKFKSKKIIAISVGFILLTGIFVYFTFYKEFSYTYLSSNILYEGVQASQINYELDKNEFGQTQAEQANYQYILEIPKDSANLSTSLRYLIEEYTYGYNIKYFPSIISTINIASYFINRSEKWGIFFAKYNPDATDFLFGYGPQQFTNYYFEHSTNYNYGLFLPHSSFLNYLIFFGVLGLLTITFILFRVLRNQNFEKIGIYFIIFFVLNFIKSDALLYLPNVILFLTILQLFTRPFSEIEE